MQYQKKVFCRGLICDKWNRKVKCFTCSVYVCGTCRIKSLANKKYYCPKCYFKTFSPDWDKMNKEFDEMIADLGLKKTEKNKNDDIDMVRV